MSDIERALAVKDTIRGDLRDIMIGAMANMTKLWRDTPETEQIALANIINAHAESIVNRIAILTATGGRPAVLVTLDSLAIAEQVRGTFTVSKEMAVALIPATKQIVAIQTVGMNLYNGERAPAKTMPDQAQLPVAPPAKAVEPPKTITLVEPVSGGGGADTASVHKPTVSSRANGAAKPARRAAKATPAPKPAAKGGGPFAK